MTQHTKPADFQTAYDLLQEAALNLPAQWAETLLPTDRKQYYQLITALCSVQEKIQRFRDKPPPKKTS